MSCITQTKEDKKYYRWFLVFVIIIGFLFRLYYFLNWAVFQADEGRDLLVARHIVVYNEQIRIGHNTSGIPGASYPPFYYYLLAAVTKIKDNPFFIYFFFVVFNTSSILFVYLAANNFFNYRVGIYSALFYAFLPMAILAANPLSCNIGLSFFA